MKKEGSGWGSIFGCNHICGYVDICYHFCYHLFMSKKDKLIQKILNGESVITPSEAVKVLERFNFKSVKTASSHLTFRKPNCPSVTIVLTQNPLKPYLIEKIQEVLTNEGYTND